MTQEEKTKRKLLLKDLCGRLPYGVIINTPKGDGHLCSINQTIFGGNEYGVNIKATERDYFNDDECDIKSYLRPMSDMTEEEIEEWDNLCVMMRNMPVESIQMVEKFVNSRHFDYRGLIRKGLALEAQKGMYNIKS